MCKASIIIPAYNAAHYIGQTIDSILLQTWKDFECIIIDDGSSDNTISVVQSYKDSRIKVIAQGNSGGPAKPRNAGLAAAAGEYIFMFDSDDIMHPEKLALSIAALDEHRDADILFSNFASIDEQGEIIKPNFLQEYDSLWNLLEGELKENTAVKITAARIYSALVRINFIGTSSVVLRKSALSSSDLFDETLKNSDDRLFWILFTKKHNAIYLNSVLHQYRIQRNSISKQDFVRRGPNKIKALEIARNDCDDVALKKILNSQIATDYANLAYAYKLKNDSKNERIYALKSIKIKMTKRSVKLLLHSTYKFFVGAG